jgi:hypothetical protein
MIKIKLILLISQLIFCGFWDWICFSHSDNELRKEKELEIDLLDPNKELSKLKDYVSTLENQNTFHENVNLSSDAENSGINSLDMLINKNSELLILQINLPQLQKMISSNKILNISISNDENLKDLRIETSVTELNDESIEIKTELIKSINLNDVKIIENTNFENIIYDFNRADDKPDQNINTSKNSINPDEMDSFESCKSRNSSINY